MHEFTLALVCSINTFILHHYFLRRMLLVATPLNGWFLQLNKFRSQGITDAASTNITVCRMSSLLLILSTFFDDNGGVVRHKRSFRAAIVFSSRTVGCGGWSWWQKTPWTTTPGKVAFPRSCRLPSAKHPNGFSPFLYLSK